MGTFVRVDPTLGVAVLNDTSFAQARAGAGSFVFYDADADTLVFQFLGVPVLSADTDRDAVIDAVTAYAAVLRLSPLGERELRTAIQQLLGAAS